MRTFGRVDSAVVRELEAIVGAGHVSTSDEHRERYSCDEMPVRQPHAPDVVVEAAATAEVSAVLRLASRLAIPVTPRGAGTGLSGGCVPLYGGILLSLERMDRVLEVDEDNFTATVQAGATLEALCQAAQAQGLYYPLHPGEMAATVGGNVAANAGGMNAVKYGVTRHFVMGLEAVLAGGEIIETGGKFVKCATGYDLTQLLVGSEGTLAVVTRVTVRLIAPPARREVMLIPFSRLEDAIRSVPDILRERVLPCGIEFMEKDIISIAEAYLGRQMPCAGGEALLMVLLEGRSDEDVQSDLEAVARVCQRNGAIDVYVPPGERARRSLLEARERFYPAATRFSPLEIADIVVPRAAIPGFMAAVKQTALRHGLPVLAYGHAGDGNVHLHPLRHGLPEAEWQQKLAAVLSELYRSGAALGGMPSGEHGLGFTKRRYLRSAIAPAAEALMRRVKQAFDPQDIMNPGKIFDNG